MFKLPSAEPLLRFKWGPNDWYDSTGLSNLFKQTPPTEGPLVNPYDSWRYYHPTEGLQEKFDA